MLQIEHDEHDRVWTRLNNEGAGYPIGEYDPSVTDPGRPPEPEDACETEGWTILWRRQHDGQICIARKPNGTIVGVGQVNGPWAIDLTEVANA